MWPPQQHQVSCIGQKIHHYEAFYIAHQLATFEVLPAGMQKIQDVFEVWCCVNGWCFDGSQCCQHNGNCSSITQCHNSQAINLLPITLCLVSKHLPECFSSHIHQHGIKYECLEWVASDCLRHGMASLKVEHHITKTNETNGKIGWHTLIFRLFESKSQAKLDVFYIWVSVHHKSIIYNESTRCNSGSIAFINNYKYALHVSDALCVHH